MKTTFTSLLFISSILLFSATAFAQQSQKQSMSEAEMDKLIDSLLVNQASSEFIINTNYQNKTLFSGRDLGVKQWNSTLSLSYYHKSGVYADFSSFMYEKSSPVWQMSAFSLGYMKDFANNLSVSFDAGRMVETNPDPAFPNQVPNWLSASLSYSFDKLVPMIDYTLLYGSESAHRLRTVLSYYLSFREIGFLDRLSFVPKVTAVWGNQEITYAQYWTGANLYSTDTGTSTSKKNPFNQILTKLGKKQQAQTGTQSYFGIMATDFALSISASKSNFRLNLTPHLVKPIKLYAAEDISTTWKFFFSTSLSYTIKN